MNINIIFTDFPPLKLFDLEISQSEDSFARAKLTLEAGIPLPPPGTEGIIMGEELHFKGYLAGLPLKVEGFFQEIELIARPLDFRTQLLKLQEAYKIHPYWDPLWVKEDEGGEVLQDIHPSSLYCDRLDLSLRRSDWFEGRGELDLGNKFFQNSLSTQLGPPPLKACTVSVHAYWIQREEGVENLSPSIRLAFPHSHVNTYTKKALVKSWPAAGHPIGRSGIWVLKSTLEEIDSPFFPSSSPSLILKETEQPPEPYRVKRHWFKATLWVRWLYQQRRKETITFTLEHAFQELLPDEGEHKRVEFTLQNINPELRSYSWCPLAFYKEGTKVFYQNATYRCTASHTAGLSFEPEKWQFRKNFYTPLGDPARSSFFSTPRGYQAAEHAMERAKTLLAKSVRAFHVTVEAPWESLKNVTTDTTIILTDPRLPGGKIRGKVSHYTLFIKGKTGEKFGRVILACSLGKGGQLPRKENERSQDLYCEEAYCPPNSALCRTASGIEYFRYDSFPPPGRPREGPFLRGINLINGPEEQEGEILNFRGQSPKALQRALAALPLRLCLFFNDFRTKGTLEHTIPITLVSPWSSVQQINL